MIERIMNTNISVIEPLQGAHWKHDYHWVADCRNRHDTGSYSGLLTPDSKGRLVFDECMNK